MLRDPAPIQFGTSVIDEGPTHADPAKRFKLGWWHGGGLNVAANGGEARVEVLDEAGRPLPGFSARDCSPIADDALAAPVAWKQPLATIRGRTICLAFALRNAKLFAFDLK